MFTPIKYISKVIFIFLLISFSAITSLQAEINVKDDKGNIVSLKKPAERIISLAPHITESLFSAGAGDKIIGVVSYSDYPEAAKIITRIGGYSSINIEKIISLKPDLIVAWGSGSNLQQIKKLSDLGFTIFLSEPYSPQDIAKTIQRFGELAGTEKIAIKSSEDFINHYQELIKRYSNKDKVKVFYQIWNKPLMTISGKHLISNIINLCGGVNIFSDLKTLTPNVSVEAVVTSNAEVIVAGQMGETNSDWANEWKPWRQLPAVKNEHIYFVNPDFLHRVGPRILQGADQLCEILEKVRNR